MKRSEKSTEYAILIQISNGLHSQSINGTPYEYKTRKILAMHGVKENMTIYSRVGSQWTRFWTIFSVQYCTIHILPNYLIVFDDFWFREHLTKSTVPWIKNHQKIINSWGVDALWFVCTRQYSLMFPLYIFFNSPLFGEIFYLCCLP